LSLSLGIVGLPNVGKSTLFNALTHNHALVANYPFATIEPNVGIVPLPDSRLERLSVLYHSAKTTPATVTFVDIAGLVRGASEGQGLGNQFLANIRETDAVVQVVRSFAYNNVVHVDGSPDPHRDIITINTELILADLATVDRRLERLTGEVKRDAKLAPLRDLAAHARTGLNDGKLAGSFLSAPERIQLADLQLLTAKPFIFVFVLNESELANHKRHSELANMVAPARSIFLSARLESELVDLPQAEAQELLQSYGQTESGLNQLTTAGFDTLGLQTFLTAGPREPCACTIGRGSTAPDAAGVIHTDFQKGFIKAEVVSYDDLIDAGSVAAARAAGKTRMEGKEDSMQIGDVVEFRFNL